MSRGKYSPTCKQQLYKNTKFIFNAKGELPDPFIGVEDGIIYIAEIHLSNYDREGFDRYGYSAYDAAGNYVGIGAGVDRNGITELQYLAMDDDEFERYV